jgi:amino acid adenylation domain-containing protein
MTDDIRIGETSSRFADLLAPAAVKAWAPLSRATVTVPQLLVDRAVAEAQAQAVWPDTPWLAAWALVAQHWTGAALTVADYNDVQADAPHRCAVYPLDLTGAPAACLQRSDQLRRHQPQASELQDPTAIDVHWHGRAEAPEAPEAAVHAHGVTAGLSRDGLSIWATAPSALADETALVACLSAVLRAAAALTDHTVLSLADIDFLGPQTLADTLRLAQPLAVPGWSALTVHERFEQQVRQHGDATALVCGAQRMTYKTLAFRSDDLAARLRSAGVVSGAAVGVALARSMDTVVALLAILKAGAAYVPLEPAYPAERLLFMMGEADVKIVVSCAAVATQMPLAGHTVLAIDDAPDPSTIVTTGLPAMDGDAAAYVVYTSGSSGQPKGIEIAHRSILRLVVNCPYVALNPSSVVLHAAPLGFDASTLEIWGPLLNGGCCVLHPEVLPTGAGLAATIREQQVNTAWLTAALFNAVVDDDVQHLRGLQQLLIGGEALSVPHVRKALQALPNTTLINGYGPSECTTFTATYRIPADGDLPWRAIPIGRPITQTRCYVLGHNGCLLPRGMVGELYVAGTGLARRYLGEKLGESSAFRDDPFGASGDRLYRTGDRVRFGGDGELEFVGRSDGQVKIRGFRIEVGEIQTALALHPAVITCAVVVDKQHVGGARLVAYLVAAAGQPTVSAASMREHLSLRLPEFMWPAAFVWLPALPVTANGKLDARALPAPPADRPDVASVFEKPRSQTEQRICGLFAAALGLREVGRRDNFFELGGNSLLVLRVLAALQADTARPLSTNLFFRDPTPAALAQAVDGTEASDIKAASRASRAQGQQAAAEPIAIVGMAGRFPGAADIEQFWLNLCAGRDSITRFDDLTLDPGVAADVRADPHYVRARGIIEDVEMFDPAFFGMTPREAELMDPQQRVFLELAWQCLEHAGYAADRTEMPVGVFAGMYNATYFQHHLAHRPDLIDKFGAFQVMLANEKDYIATRTAHRLNLTGPAISVHSACSTSLVAVVQAFDSLRAGHCDMALAGAVAVTCPPRSGYIHQEGAMLSPDGHTRSFSADAAGTVFSDGGAVVLLKRLRDAQADGDTVYAVLRGAAVNNDGKQKASFTAPSELGQSAVIAAAMASAGVSARSISYVEAHGTATPLGDPVEVAALTRAFAGHTTDRGFCALGSLKSNVGHMVVAAGAAGLIKTALSMWHEKLPPSIHFDRANPQIDFDNSPFQVQTELANWPRGKQPRRAGVSSFGVGGTNAHVVVEEAPQPAAVAAAEEWLVLRLSARSSTALDQMAQRLADHLDVHAELTLPDVAHTLDVGRTRFAERLAVVANSRQQAATRLRDAAAMGRSRRTAAACAPSLVWLFPGQGAQYPAMGSGLYGKLAPFSRAFDECLAALQPWLDIDLRAGLQAHDEQTLQMTAYTQPATFCLSYALARQWLATGMQPQALVGHSVGEFAAAVIAGVMSLADAAKLVALRGAMMQALPGGSMLSVRLPAAQMAARLPPTLALAAHNAPSLCVVAGPTEAIAALQAQLDSEGVVWRALQTSHAFHSAMMDPAVAPFEAEVRRVQLSAPVIPMVSTLTGALLTDEQACDPHYWARHLRDTVRFSDAVTTALARGNTAFLEIGPRGSLSTLVRQHTTPARKIPAAVASLADTPASEVEQFTSALGSLWTLGLETTPALTPGRLRIALPSYPFERQRCWIDAPAAQPSSAALPMHQAMAAAFDNAPSFQPQPAKTLSANMSDATRNDSTPTAQASLVARLRELFEDVAGVDLDPADSQTPFVELGLDSLTLTQAAMQVKKQFRVAVTFRQLMEQLGNLDALAGHLVAQLPAEPAPEAMSVAAPVAALAPAVAQAPTLQPTAALSPSPAGTSLVQQVIAQQMQLMAQQLALLGAGASMKPPAEAEVAAPVASAGAALVVPKQAGSDVATPMRYDVKKAFGAIARIHTHAQPMTERQQARLDAFVRRYVDRTEGSKAYTTRHRPHLADPRVVNGFRPMLKEITYQIVIERSKGAKVWDVDGNEYVDVLNGFGMNMFGWQPEFVQRALTNQLESGYEIGPQHPLAGEVAKLICELSGCDRAALCNTGSEAVMAAVRIARTVTGRNTLVLFSGAYHGTFDEVLVRAGRHAQGMPAAPGIMSGAFGDVRVLDYGTPESLTFIREQIDDIAAVLVEPVQSRRPEFQPREFLHELRDITKQGGACLIFDEVITGFRCHQGGVQALMDIRADLVCYGKVIGGGLPVGVVAGQRDYMDALDGGAWQFGDVSFPTVGVTYFAGTFVRHPLALAAAHAALVHLKAAGPQLQTQLNSSTQAMAEELNAYCREVQAPIEIRHFSSLWRVAWLADHPLQDLLFAMMRSRGIHILDNFPCFMTTAHSAQDIANIKQAFKDSVAELQESAFLPQPQVNAVLPDTQRPPRANARLGRDKDGTPTWFVPHPEQPGKFVKVPA